MGIKLIPIYLEAVIKMININTDYLKNHLDKAINYVKKYEVIVDNISYQLNQCKENWIDIKSDKLNDILIIDKRESDLFLQSLKKDLNVYNKIYNEISPLGKKIAVDIDKENEIIGKIENEINSINEIKVLIRSLNNTIYYNNNYDSFINIMNKLNNDKQQLENSKNIILNIINKIRVLNQYIDSYHNKKEILVISDIEV